MTDLTQEQVLAQLQTRGFESGGFRSPLRHFRGKLDTITGSMEQRGQMPQAKLEVHYNLSELEIFQTTEPYPSPITQINIWHNNRDNSPMGVLGKSIDAIINAGENENALQAAVKNQDFLIGKIQEWKVTPGHMMWDGDQQKQTPRDAWEIVYIEGVGGTPHSGVATPATTNPAPTATVAPAAVLTPAQQALNLLDNKTQQDWNSLVFQDPIVRGDPALVKTIIDATFLSSMEAAGQVTKDENGVYHINKD